MGTRADFYIGKGKDAEWIGSISYDGYPDDERIRGLFNIKIEKDYRASVEKMFSERDDATLPEEGWPWPWDDSHTTDWSYTFADGEVWASSWGNEWFDPLKKLSQDDMDKMEETDFPDMAKRKNVTLGKRSGIGLWISEEEKECDLKS